MRGRAKGGGRWDQTHKIEIYCPLSCRNKGLLSGAEEARRQTSRVRDEREVHGQKNNIKQTEKKLKKTLKKNKNIVKKNNPRNGLISP